ncbi:MAG: hypothetical protein NVSMB29_15980 [Candidatus Dormibacteria bacterium]
MTIGAGDAVVAAVAVTAWRVAPPPRVPIRAASWAPKTKVRLRAIENFIKPFPVVAHDRARAR